MNEPITTKFKVDISDLKANIQEANRHIRMANSEFKAASSGMEDWANSADGLSAKTKQLTTILQAQQVKLAQLQIEYEQVVQEQGENSIAAQNLMIKINNQQAAVNKAAKELKDYQNKLDDLENSSDDAASAVDDLGDSLNEAGNAAEEASDGFTVVKGTLSSLIADGLRAACAALKDFAMESDTAYSKFQAQTGASAKEMEEFKSEMDELYKNNYGESLQDIGDKMAYVKQVTGEVDPSKLKELTKNAIALEDTFGSDFNETVRGVNNLMTHFGITSQEAFDLFAKGSQLGLDYTSELGDNIAEYGGNFMQAGYSAEEYFQLLVNGSQNGAYNLDKVNDSINEIKNRLGDGTIEKNIDSFSNGTKTAFENWQNGKGTMKDVIDSIVKDIDRAESEQESLTMAQIAFGTMGEDANLKVVKSLTTVGDSFEDVKGTMDEVNQTRYDNVSSQLSQLGRTLQLEVLAPIAEDLLPIVKDGVNWIVNNIPLIESAIVGVGTAMATYFVANKILGVVNAFKAAKMATEGLTVSQWLLNAAMNANPIMLIITLVAGLVAGLITLWNTNEDFRNAVIEIWNNVQEVVGGVIDELVNFFTVTIPESIQGMIDWFKKLPEQISTWLTETWNKVVTWGQQMIQKAIEVGSKFIQNVITFFQQLPGKIWGFLTTVISNVSNWVDQMIQKAIQAGSQFLSSVINFIAQLPGKIWSLLMNVISNLASWVGQMGSKGAEAARSLFDNVVNGLISLPGRMVSIGGDVVRGIWSGISGMGNWLWRQVTSFANGIVDGIKGALKINSPSKVMRDVVGMAIPEGIGVGINKYEKTAMNPVKKLASNMIDEASKMKDALHLDDMKMKLSSNVESLKSKIASGTIAVQEQVKEVRDIVFNQYNNSPKALSRLDIYRQTKSQLFGAKRTLKYV